MLPQLQAERQLAAIEAASFPDMKQSAQNSLIGRYSSLVNARTRAARATAAGLESAGIQVEYVKETGDE